MTIRTFSITCAMIVIGIICLVQLAGCFDEKPDSDDIGHIPILDKVSGADVPNK